jgi:hypothetical protein
MKFLLAVLFVLPSHALVRVQEDASRLIYDIHVDGVAFKQRSIEGREFAEMKLTGVEGLEAVRFAVGETEIPVLRFFVDAKEARDIQVTARRLKARKSVLSPAELKPSLPGLAKIAGASYGVINHVARKSALPAFTVEAAGSIRGTNRFLVTLYPVEVRGDEVAVTRSFAVEVTKAPVAKAAAKGMVFVVGEKFKTSGSLAQYMATKAAAGLDVQTISVKKGQRAEETRADLKKLYAAKPHMKYAVIVGEVEDVMGKDSDIIAGLTDHFFAAIDTASYEDDIATPDLQVGRISVTSEAELAVVLAKYTRYGSRGGERGWITRAAFIGTDDQWEIAEGSHNYAIETHLVSKGYTGSFPESLQAGGDRLYAVTHNADGADVLRALQEGRSIVDYSGHGATTYWDAPRLEQDDVRALRSNSLPFVISNACITADYRVRESFAETWQRAPNGASMFWGSMDSTYWDEDDILERRMFDGIFSKRKRTFGDITQYALAEMYRHYGGNGYAKYYQETYHMFGDPSLSLVLR